MSGQFDTSNINYDSLQNMSAKDDGVLGWDSCFNQADARSADTVPLLPEDTYDFTVDDFERSNYPGGPKLPTCPKAEVTLKIVDPEGKIHKVFSNFYLCKNTEWKIAEFFDSIGLTGPNGEVDMSNWNKVVGRSGRARIKQRTYTNRDGVQKTVNDVEAYLPKQVDLGFIGGNEALPF